MYNAVQQNPAQEQLMINKLIHLQLHYLSYDLVPVSVSLILHHWRGCYCSSSPRWLSSCTDIYKPNVMSHVL